MGTDIAAGNVMDAADTAMNVVADAVTAGATDMKQAMRQRHTVRKFTSEPLSPELISQLNDRVRANNERFGLAISLKVGDESALPGALKLFFAKGVRNYFVLAGSDRPGLDEDLGYASADLMLFAQALGLNTWWIGGTFNRKNVEQAVPGKKVIGIVPLALASRRASRTKARQRPRWARTRARRRSGLRTACRPRFSPRRRSTSNASGSPAKAAKFPSAKTAAHSVVRTSAS